MLDVFFFCREDHWMVSYSIHHLVKYVISVLMSFLFIRRHQYRIMPSFMTILYQFILQIM